MIFYYYRVRDLLAIFPRPAVNELLTWNNRWAFFLDFLHVRGFFFFFWCKIEVQEGEMQLRIISIFQRPCLHYKAVCNAAA